MGAPGLIFQRCPRHRPYLHAARAVCAKQSGECFSSTASRHDIVYQRHGFTLDSSTQISTAAKCGFEILPPLAAIQPPLGWWLTTSLDAPIQDRDSELLSERASQDLGLVKPALHSTMPVQGNRDENVRALEATIEALRRIERHGASALLDQALSGFTALPPASDERPAWWEVLGLPARPPALSGAESAYRLKAAQIHPDRGGDGEGMAALNGAIREARESFGEESHA